MKPPRDACVPIEAAAALALLGVALGYLVGVLS